MQVKLLLLFLFSLTAAADDKLGFQCVGRHPTTSFFLEENGEHLVLKMLHHNGVEYMPIHEGVIVPNDLPYLEHKAQLLTRLGSQVEFRFPKAKCQSYGEGLIACRAGERKNIGGLDVEALHLLTEKNTRHAFDMKIEYRRVELSLHVAGDPPVKEISMNYEPNECKFGL